ncbi:geranylgeranyl transferase type-2 subunit alpha-like [Argiope bruennichi]|uniref:geranylgeranyl transferase type-2 subunit alpha-like n=1 Tax=Argiope bruennichi TaxID=94029 RepID=UPI002493E290|nr:geranylgeranyl transferase type-2 subunit alpha-like [Argiope bruennichi]
MHGRVKVRTTEEQAEIKRREQQEKLKIYLGATRKIFAKRAAEEYDEEALELTGRILEKNPDFYTLWNYRREILMFYKTVMTEEDLKQLCLNELDLTQNCLRTNPKSYATWHHRFWMMEFQPEADWNRELRLCSYFLTLDERNFHCWDYRRLVGKKCNVSPEQELNYSTRLIEANFSNYSAWHYRSTLLPVVHYDSSKGSVKEDVLLKEFDLIQNAAFTDPDDQSVWFYHRWLLGRSKMPLEILNLSVFKSQNTIAVLFSEPVEVDSKSLLLKLNGKNLPVSWQSVDGSRASTIWKCLLPVSEKKVGNFLNGDEKFEVSVRFSNGIEECCLTNTVNGNKSSTWNKINRANIFRADFSAAAKDVLERELESCQQLNEMEPNSKWTLFTCVLLMRALNNSKFQNDIEDFMEKLTKVDSARKNYYKDLGSKFVIEDTIESLPVEATEVNLSNKKLTRLCHFDQLILIEKIDLSSNNLTSVYPLRYLMCVKSINLDDNQLSSLEGVEELENLEILSIKRNYLKKENNLESLKTCLKLKELFLEGNPIMDDTEYQVTLKMLPALKLIDGSEL